MVPVNHVLITRRLLLMENHASFQNVNQIRSTWRTDIAVPAESMRDQPMIEDHVLPVLHPQNKSYKRMASARNAPDTPEPMLRTETALETHATTENITQTPVPA